MSAPLWLCHDCMCAIEYANRRIGYDRPTEERRAQVAALGAVCESGVAEDDVCTVCDACRTTQRGARYRFSR